MRLLFVLIWGILGMVSITNAENKIQGKQTHPSDHFRQEHVEIKKHLSEIENLVGELQTAPSASTKESLKKILVFFKDHIKPHAEWEERKLYPAVDKRVGSSEVFTATMRHEHKIVARWVDDLDKQAAEKSPNLKKFSRQADQLIGLIKAHFENEEEILLPILDKSMTAEQFKTEILDEKTH